MLVSFREKREQDIKANFKKVMPTKQNKNKTNKQTNKQTKTKKEEEEKKEKKRRLDLTWNRRLFTFILLCFTCVPFYWVRLIFVRYVDQFVLFHFSTWQTHDIANRSQKTAKLPQIYCLMGRFFSFFSRTNILLSLPKLYISLSILFHLILTAPPPKETSLREPLSLGEKK